LRQAVLAFSNYHFIEVNETLNIYKRISKLYDRRSKIIHTGLRETINELELSEICRYTSYVILSLFDFRNQGYTELREIGGEIERLYRIINQQKIQTITELANKIDKLLEETSACDSMNTTAEKMIIAAKTIEHIENSSELMQEITNVIIQGAITDLAKLLAHPSAPFLIMALETCQKKNV
jgi:transcriptional regulator CtsR